MERTHELLNYNSSILERLLLLFLLFWKTLFFDLLRLSALCNHGPPCRQFLIDLSISLTLSEDSKMWVRFVRKKVVLYLSVVHT